MTSPHVEDSRLLRRHSWGLQSSFLSPVFRSRGSGSDRHWTTGITMITEGWDETVVGVVETPRAFELRFWV